MVLLSHCFTSCLLPFPRSFCHSHLMLSCFILCWDLGPSPVFSPYENSVGLLGLPHLPFLGPVGLSGSFLCCFMLIHAGRLIGPFSSSLLIWAHLRPIFFSLGKGHLTWLALPYGPLYSIPWFFIGISSLWALGTCPIVLAINP